MCKDNEINDMLDDILEIDENLQLTKEAHSHGEIFEKRRKEREICFKAIVLLSAYDNFALLMLLRYCDEGKYENSTLIKQVVETAIKARIATYDEETITRELMFISQRNENAKRMAIEQNKDPDSISKFYSFYAHALLATMSIKEVEDFLEKEIIDFFEPRPPIESELLAKKFACENLEHRKKNKK